MATLKQSMRPSILLVLISCFIHLVKPSHVYYQNLQAVKSSIVSPLYRTAFHFQPQKHWINDPNGPMYYNGFYHLFYQYNPRGAVWGNIVWAHSVSKDLVNWKPVKPALYPSEPFDVNGCWSGSATILPGNRPVMLYTGIDTLNRQVQNMAVPKNLSDPYLTEWVKPDHNPLMAPTSENGINASSFRDPTTAWYGQDGLWRVLVGNKRGRRGIAILYRSRDFVRWVKSQHPLHSSKDTGMWECPDFFPVSKDGRRVGVETSTYTEDVKHVLKVSLDDNKCDYYTVGRYMQNRDRYVPQNHSIDGAHGLRYDYGKFYASKTFFDPVKQRRILFGWTNESDSVRDDVMKGWAGLQSVPRFVWLDGKGAQLLQWPIEELERLRGEKTSISKTYIKQGERLEVTGITAAQADVEVSFKLPNLNKAETFDPKWTNPQVLCGEKGADAGGSIGPFGLLTLASTNLEEYTAIFFRVYRDGTKPVVLMCSDQTRSTLRKEVDKTPYGAFVDADLKHGKLSMRILIDHSIVESFGEGGKVCITSRVYPKLAILGRVHLFAFNQGSEPVKITKLQAWSMKRASIN